MRTASISVGLQRWLMSLALVFALVDCTADSGEAVRIVPTGRVGRALDSVDGVQATAFVVPQGGAPITPGQMLSRGDDGISFSGFIALAPGNYRLEVVFRGQPEGAPGVVFIGRWTSDAFTVADGATANAVFSSPIDTIGRPEDEGDLDNDGLGLLDEYLWNADPEDVDADDDGRRDGDDCSPGDAADTYEIVAGGTIEDCDGDGQRRPDIDYAPGGTDCNDRDPAIRPGATDDCADAIDQDCNPATCPLNDSTAPVFTAVTPAPGSAVGCHSAIEVTVEDEGRVASVSLTAPDVVSGGNDTLVATQVGETDVWRFSSFNVLAASTTNGLQTGERALRLQAIDQAGNQVRRDVQFDFQLMQPTVPTLTPATVGQQSEPFTMAIEANGAASIALWAATRQRNDLFAVTEATLIGEAAGSTAAFSVDPAQFADGQWLLFPRIADAVGNRLQPAVTALPLPNPSDGTLEMASDFACIGRPPPLPVRVMTVGTGGGFEKLAWGGLLSTALAAAAAEDEALALVSIVGIGLDADGRIDLSDATSFSNRWIFGFRTPGTTRTFSATWLTPALNPGENPLIDPAGSGVVAETPLVDAAALPDSTTLMAAYAVDANCGPLSGRGSDLVVYTVVDGTPQVTVSNEEGEAWLVNIEADGSISEVFDCP